MRGIAISASLRCARLRLDKLWWLVTPGNPLKSAAHLPDLADRLSLAAELRLPSRD